MLDKFKRTYRVLLRLLARRDGDFLPIPPAAGRILADHARIDVVRHRVARLGERGRQLVAVTTALTGIGLGAVAADAAIPGSEPVSAEGGNAGAEDALAQRDAAADGADRAQRSEPDQDGSNDEDANDAGEVKASAPKEPKKKSSGKREKDKPKKTKQPPKWVHPMPGAGTTSCFGRRWGSLHAGVDLASPPGTPIHAVGAGTVVNAGWAFPGYGKSVMVDHGNGFLTHYAHASRVTVSLGDQVKPGETIAREGSTGNSTGPHLHFEVHKGKWNQVEPTRWLRKRDVKVGGC